MIYIPKKNQNEVKYDETLAKKMHHVIIVNDKESSNTGDLFSIWNQKTNVFISSELGDFFDFINENKISEKTNILIIGTKNINFEVIEEYYNLITFYLYYKKELVKYKKNIIKINKSLSSKKDNDIVNDSIEKFIHLNSDGKFLRALLISIGYNIASKREDDYYMPLAMAYETFQTSILIHDDIIDEADLRRNKVTIQKSYNDYFNSFQNIQNKKVDHTAKSLALCVGDLGIFFTNKILLDNYNEDFVRLYKYYNEIVLKTIKGEILDVYLPFSEENLERKSSEADIFDIYRLKTAWYSVIGPVGLGLILGKAKDVEIRKMEKILEGLGIAFQIKDDILGIYGDSKKLGKSTNSDISEYKQTLLYVHAARSKFADELKEIYGKKNLSKSDLKDIKNIFEESGALARAEQTLADNLNQAKSLIIKNKYIPKFYRDVLLGFVSYLNLREK